MIPTRNDAKTRTPQEVAELVQTVSDDLVRYAFCVVGEVNAAEEIALKSIADFVYRNTYRALSTAYLWRMTYTRAVDHLRRKRHEASLSGLEDVLSAGPTAEQEAEAAERHRLLYRAVAALPVDYRNAVYLCYLEGFSVEEAARVMGKKVKQVYNLLSRGKVSLREWFAKEGYRYEDL